MSTFEGFRLLSSKAVELYHTVVFLSITKVFYQHTDPLDRKLGLYVVTSVTCKKDYSDRDNGMLSSNTRHCTPLECRRKEESCSIDISLRWSENHSTKERVFEASHRAKTSVTCQANRSGRNNRMSPWVIAVYGNSRDAECRDSEITNTRIVEPVRLETAPRRDPRARIGRMRGTLSNLLFIRLILQEQDNDQQILNAYNFALHKWNLSRASLPRNGDKPAFSFQIGSRRRLSNPR